jgi:hypothetical protein
MGAKKKCPNAHAHLQNPSKKHPPASIFLFSSDLFSVFVCLHFQAFLRKLSSKTPNGLFGEKVDLENVLQKNKKYHVVFSVIC